ncbi:hypothetical protein Srot_0894 [Segniliparus rotundus DSM 44985]|uniref:Uncharacterized protein n=1 Tax=Segniliparus rotundus (strain ATCC BAA-972 / CDC 1076 / CIP 108378 / DSM 44985 / JCM 13578) TaxID=640132 RepID=D6ZE91_SEGRD|nr:hypothetical protein [Segniliparus rotundus]ADG97371.1 hypothetical protein Srot_0894 [Segniliparus rotundus DSM 44985]
MSDGTKAPWWSVVSFLAAYVAVYAAGSIVIERNGPQLWAGVLLLACACATFAWTAARNAPEPGTTKRTPREILLGRPGIRGGAALRMWSWHNYPFFIAFTSFMLATQEFQLLYGYWRALLITTGSVLLVVAAQRYRSGRRGKVTDQ